MAEKLKVELVTPYKKVMSEEVDEITATSALGEFGVLPGHAPFLTSLKIGELAYKQDGVSHHMALNWGYFEVENDKVTGEEHLLVDRGRRIRDVRQGPEGALYIVTDETNGELWKLSPRR